MKDNSKIYKMCKGPWYIVILITCLLISMSVTACDPPRTHSDLLTVRISPDYTGEVTVVYPYTEDIYLSGKIWVITNPSQNISAQRGEKVRLTAIPAVDYKFDHWEGDASGSEDSVEITLTASTNVTACFVGINSEAEEEPDWEALEPGGQPSDWETPEEPAPEESPAQEPAVNVILRSVTSYTRETESDCHSDINVAFKVSDLGVSAPAKVELKLDGEKRGLWDEIFADPYQSVEVTEVDCYDTYTVEVVATNKDGHSVTATKEVVVPPLHAVLQPYIVDFIQDESGCRAILQVYYAASDFTDDSPITRVELWAGEEIWDSSPDNMTMAFYEDMVTREVVCGRTYVLSVIATDADGSDEYSTTIIIPTPTPTPEPSPEPPPSPTETLYVAFAAEARSMSSNGKCSSTITISFDGKDLTGGDYPITSVILRVTGPDGTKSYDSKPISNPHHHDTKSLPGLDCGVNFNIEVIVTNSIGQTVTSTGPISTPIP